MAVDISSVIVGACRDGDVVDDAEVSVDGNMIMASEIFKLVFGFDDDKLQSLVGNSIFLINDLKIQKKSLSD